MADVLRQANVVLRCAKAAGLESLDTYDAIERVVCQRGIDAVYIRDHHTPFSNRLVAETIAATLRAH